MAKEKDVFFKGLPQGKDKGFCEPPVGDIHNSTVVSIETECRVCPWNECHMFSSEIQGGKIVAKVFINHPPEYNTSQSFGD